MNRIVLRRITTLISIVAVVAMVMPSVASAATRRVRVKVKVCSSRTHRCSYVYRYKYVYLARGTPLGIKSYKPRYNVMSTGTSRRGTKPKAAIAVCADGRYAYGTPSKLTCSTHHGVAWWFVKH